MPMATFPTLYDLLNLPPTATAAEIDDAYEEWVLGDDAQDDPEASPSMAGRDPETVREAFELLRDPGRRRQYDDQRRIAAEALPLLDAAKAALETDPAEAVRLARRAVEIAPDQAAPRFVLTNALLALNDSAAAETELRGLVATLPDEAFARFMLARFLLQQERPADAEAELVKVLERDPEHNDALMLLALVSRDSGRYDLAAELLERSVMADGIEDWRDADALLGLLIVHALRDDPGEFRSVLERVGAAVPPGTDAADDAAHRLLALAVEFFNAGSFDYALDVSRALRPDWVADPVLEDQIAQIVPALARVGEAAAMSLDDRVTPPLRRFAAIRYLPGGEEIDDAARQAVLDGLQHEAAGHPDQATVLYDYVEQAYPAFAQDNAELLETLRYLVAESLPPEEDEE